MLLGLLSCALGTKNISLAESWAALASFDAGNNDHLLVRELRVPRTLLAVVVGAGLGLAGALMQSMTRNPLAEPGLLGVNAGAAFAVAIAITLGVVQPAGYMSFAFAGRPRPASSSTSWAAAGNRAMTWCAWCSPVPACR